MENLVIEGIEFQATLKKFSVDENGVFRTKLEWSFKDKLGTSHTIESDVVYELVNDYDSEVAGEAYYKHNGVMYKSQAETQNPSITGLDWNHPVFYPECVSDMVVQEFLKKNYPNEWPIVEEMFACGLEDLSQIDELIRFSPNGDGVFI